MAFEKVDYKKLEVSFLFIPPLKTDYSRVIFLSPSGNGFFFSFFADESFLISRNLRNKQAYKR